MRRLLNIFMWPIFFWLPALVYAQQKRAAYIYRTDNTINAFACLNIDSITYEGEDDMTCQLIWTRDSIYKVSTEDVDSISFSTPKNVIMEIAEEDLNGWEMGYTLYDEYLVAYKDSAENMLVTMIGKVGDGQKNGIILCFDDDDNVVKVGTMEKLYNVKYEEDKIILNRIDDGGEYEELQFPISQAVKAHRSMKRAPSNDIIDWTLDVGVPNLLRGLNMLGNVLSGISLGSNVMNGAWANAARDGGMLLAGVVIKNPVTGVIVSYVESTVEHYINQNNEQRRTAMYADCEISIKEIKFENNSRVVYATIHNANNLPDYLFRAMYDHEMNDETRNLVSCGVVVSRRNERVSTHNYDYKSQETPLNGDVSYGSEAYLSFTIPEFDDGPIFTTYYVRPYLTSTRMRDKRGNVSESYIKYGEVERYKCPILELGDTKQNSCSYHESSSEYSVDVSIDATIEDNQGVTQWGVCVNGPDGELVKEVTTSPISTEYTFKYQDFLPESALDKTSKTFKLRAVPYAVGLTSNERAYGEAKDFEVKVSNDFCPDANHPHWIDLGLPSGTQWRCCNEGASTPEAFGGYYHVLEVSTAPKLAQIRELFNHCTSVWTQQNGVNGRKFIGPNGGSIFLPAAGIVWDGELNFVGSCGYYWSSTPQGGLKTYAFAFDSDDAEWYYDWNYDSLCFSVRPVR